MPRTRVIWNQILALVLIIGTFSVVHWFYSDVLGWHTPRMVMTSIATTFALLTAISLLWTNLRIKCQWAKFGQERERDYQEEHQRLMQSEASFMQPSKPVAATEDNPCRQSER